MTLIILGLRKHLCCANYRDFSPTVLEGGKPRTLRLASARPFLMCYFLMKWAGVHTPHSKGKGGAITYPLLGLLYCDDRVSLFLGLSPCDLSIS